MRISPVQTFDLNENFSSFLAFIRVLFDMFYDEDIIAEYVFWTWKKEAREEGHAISALSLKSFFDWLSEPDPN